MDQVKHWLTSKTVWVAALGALVQILTLLKVENPLDGVDVGVLADHLVNLASAVLFIAAGVFRVTATKRIG